MASQAQLDEYSKIQESLNEIFHGCDEIGGSQKTYQLAMDYINSFSSREEKAKSIAACIVLIEKPKQFIATGTYGGGKTVAMKTDANKLIDYLPMHSEDELLMLGNTPEEKEKSKALRSSLGPLSHVNFTCVKNIAYMSLTAASALSDASCIIKHCWQWINQYGGSPVAVLATLKSDTPPIPKGDPSADKKSAEWKESETLRIKIQDLMKYKANQVYWTPHIAEFRKVLTK